MISLEEIQLINFISHKDSKIKFKNPQKLLIDGISGSGKSSIVEALIWALYGKGRSDNRSMIKNGESVAKVVVLLKDTKDNKVINNYRIERVINKKGKHELKIHEKTGKVFVPIKENGLRNIQEHLEAKILKSSYLLFINSIAYPQDNTENFVKQTAIKRKEILLEIINAASYDEYYKNAKVKISEFEERNNKYVAEFEYLNEVNEEKRLTLLNLQIQKRTSS